MAAAERNASRLRRKTVVLLFQKVQSQTAAETHVYVPASRAHACRNVLRKIREPRQGRSQKFVSERGKQGNWGQKSPSGVQGQSPGAGLGVRPQKLKTHMLITIPKTPNFFQHGKFQGDMSPLPPPFPTPLSRGHQGRSQKFVLGV